jgi:RimJ/RimL family protein N-acetyltransferase
VKELMINYAFQYVDKIILHIGANNLRSQIATMRFGAVKTGEFYTEDQYGKRLSFEYTLKKDDWVNSRI